MLSTSPREARKTGPSLGFAVERFQRTRIAEFLSWEADNIEIRPRSHYSCFSIPTYRSTSVAFADDDDARFGDGVPCGAIFIEIIADFRSFRQADTFINDRSTNLAVSANLDSVEQN